MLTFRFIELCKGDLDHRPKRAKITLGLNQYVTFRICPYITSRHVNTWLYLL